VNDFETLLERMVPGAGLDRAADSPPFPAALGLECKGVIGRGGTGWVFRAHDPLLNRDVAVKVARPEGGEAARQALLAEARVTSRIQHPAVLPVHRVVDCDGTLCVIYRLAPRTTLEEVIHGNLRHLLHVLAPQARMHLAQEAAGAVVRAHTLGVVHGDLHPGNVVLGPDVEPYILDWGGVGRAQGEFSGHPGYAAPERLRGDPPSPESDVYSMAVISWELATSQRLRTRYPDEDLGTFIARWREGGTALPDAGLHPALHQLIQEGLNRDPSQRPTAKELVTRVRLYLTGQADLEARNQAVQKLLAIGRDALEDHRDLKERIEAEHKVAAVQRAKVPAHAPPSQKRPLWEAEDRVAQLFVEQETTWVSAVESTFHAWTLNQDNQAARALLAELWWTRFLQIEGSGGPSEIATALERLRIFDDGRYARALATPATVSLAVDVPGATATLHRFIERERVLVPERVDRFELPWKRRELGPGSWLLTIEAPGCERVIYPVSLRRREHHRGQPTLLPTGSSGEGFVRVTAGAFRMGAAPLTRQTAWRPGGRGPLRTFQAGGDPLARNPVESCSPTLGDFYIARTCVRSDVYLAFLNDLPRREANRHVPGEAGLYDEYRPYWECRKGRWRLPEDWDPAWPVVAISLDDASAYADWASVQTGRPLRLPTEEEWEKAARGVDGRAFPWGQALDPTFAHMRRSQPGAPKPAAVGVYPVDCSVWGCLDMAGGVREWTSSAYDHAQIVVRSGSWQDDADELRCAGRRGLASNGRSSQVGFRLVSTEPVVM
jgi:serine/threonine-protein kinase